jgi:hypothetical protein
MAGVTAASRPIVSTRRRSPNSRARHLHRQWRGGYGMPHQIARRDSMHAPAIVACRPRWAR